MNEWIDDLSDLSAAGEDAVVVTVAGIRGSAPREVGAKMIVSDTSTIGTIGGGQLEYQCARIAVGMLNDSDRPTIRRFPLGTSMGQCCGGVVDILFEPITTRLPAWLHDIRALHGQRKPAVIVTDLAGAHDKFVVTENDTFGMGDAVGDDVIAMARDSLRSRLVARRLDGWFLECIVSTNFNIAVFGAGHVGSATVRSLSALDCNIRWIDNRRNIFRRPPANVRTIESTDPALEVAAMPARSCYLIMTHSHAIDYEICERVLRRRDYIYCGLIGSVSKRRRFEQRYRAAGLQNQDLGRLVCPIGVEGISGKKPAEIAVAATAQVLRAWEQAASERQPAYPDNVRPLKRRR